MVRYINNRLPVLMYHNVSDKGPVDDLTVTTLQLERHFEYINKKKYTAIFLTDLIDYTVLNKPLPTKPLLLTFDDGYKNNFTNLYPLLLKYNLKASIFLIAGFLQTPGECNAEHSEFLHTNDIVKFDKDIVEFALHTYDHKSYVDLSIEEIDADIKRSKQRLEQLNVPYTPCLAYTYGAYPKKDEKKLAAMFHTLKSNGIDLAMRIGNRINKLPIKNNFLIERIDIRGNESFLKFRISLAAGRKILFK